MARRSLDPAPRRSRGGASESLPRDVGNGSNSDDGGGSEGAPPPSASRLRRLVLASTLGVMLEWYVFGVFSSWSEEISAMFFIGRFEEVAEWRERDAVKWARLLGGLVLGWIGDSHGRTLSLRISIAVMTAGALAMVVIPANSFGVYSLGCPATVLLIIVRIALAFSAGGEMVGSLLFMAESAPPKSKFLATSIPVAAASLGTGIAHVVSAIIQRCLSDRARELYGWRLAFLLGLPVGFAGFALRSHVGESQAFAGAAKKFRARHPKEHPFAFALRQDPLRLLVFCALTMVACGFVGAASWYQGDWLETFYTEHLSQKGRNLTSVQAKVLNTLILFGPSAGGTLATAWAVDSSPGMANIPSHCLMMMSAMLIIVASPINLLWMSRGTECLACVALAQAGQVLCSAPATAALATHLAVAVPRQLQFTSMALAYNAGLATFGHTMPTVASAIHQRMNDANGLLAATAPALYLSSLAAVALGSLILTCLPSVKQMRQDFELAVS